MKLRSRVMILVLALALAADARLACAQSQPLPSVPPGFSQGQPPLAVPRVAAQSATPPDATPSAAPPAAAPSPFAPAAATAQPPAALPPAAQVPAGNAPVAQPSDAQVPAGRAPVAQPPSGQEPAAQDPAASSSVPPATVPAGQGPRPQGEPPSGAPPESIPGPPATGAGVRDQSFAKPEMTVRLPAGWVEIPRQTLDSFTAAVSKASSKALEERYDYGFQRDVAAGWFTYPYMLIQIKSTGRLREYDLLESRRSSVKEGMEEGTRVATDSLSFLSNARVSEPVYDDKRCALFSMMSMDVQGQGPVRLMTGVYLSESGVIAVHLYAPDATFDALAPTFQYILGGITLAPSLAYHSRLFDRWPAWVEGAASGGLLGLLLGGVVLVVRRARR